MNIKHRSVWKQIELDGRELAMYKIAYSAAATATRPAKVSVIVRRHGVEIYDGVPIKGNQLFSDMMVAWIPVQALSLENLTRYVTEIEAREIIAVHRMNRNQLIQVLRREAS